MFRKNCNSEFYIKSGDIGFADRQKSIFDQLAAVEKVQNERQRTRDNAVPSDELTYVDMGGNSKRSLKRHRSEMKQFRGQESIFKKPEDPPRFVNKTKPIPDYHKNPHKWVKYSLGDISQEDMSNSSNTAAAFSFLQEIAARKERNDNMDGEEECMSKIVFKQAKLKAITSKESAAKPKCSTEDVRPSFKSSKLVMPEYVVGQRKKKEHKKKSVKPLSGSQKEIPLLHLMIEEEVIKDDEDGID